MHRAAWIGAVVGAVLLQAQAARAADIKVLSAAAVTPGLEQAAKLYERRSGHAVTLEYATGPEIQQRIGDGEAGFDVVVAPEAVLATLAKSGRLKAEPVRLGRVGIAVAIKAGAPRPDISNAAALKRSLLAAKTVVASRGSTGVYLDTLFQRMGVTEPLGDRLVRGRNGAAVVERLATGEGAEIGLTAQTELMLGRDRGVIVVGPLPPEVQLYTTYAAAAFPEAAARPEITALMALLKGREGQAAMVANGIE